MEEKMTQYLKSIGITEIVEKRVIDLIEQVENTTMEKAVDILVVDYVNEEGMRIYEKLRVWTESFKIIIGNFLTESQINISSKDERIVSVEINARDFDFKVPTTISRIFIVGHVENDYTVPMKGSGINCAHVMEMYRKYFVPNIRRST